MNKKNKLLHATLILCLISNIIGIFIGYIYSVNNITWDIKPEAIINKK